MCRIWMTGYPKALLFGQLKDPSHIGKPRIVCDAVVLFDTCQLYMSCLHRTAQ